ncbi:hypothetical protein [Alkalihalobacillus pseudalcaliphilus]|uniref:hypothetical protein n=1 Tax=Alkalihalobacillus pseudalcaliphilus TaxID=79884 RepID=UPI00064DA715|nr:hypothetical protein [Alkalihalobacillus pseudalcaliphilus]KMK74757.1 hypothetical protein AB990_19930 [Alkalihalobacillus pseudalcaliphilus]
MASYIANDIRQDQHLHTDIRATYRKLISSRYFTKGQLEWVTQDLLKRLSHQYKDQITALIFYYIEEVINLIPDKASYVEHERRFLHFYQVCTDYLLNYLNQKPEHFTFMAETTLTLLENQNQLKKPWAPFLYELYVQVDQTKRAFIYHLISSSKQLDGPLHRKVGIVYSYILLDQGDKEVALDLLMTIKDLQEIEVSPHFQLLKKDKAYETLANWFEKLWTGHHSPSYYGSLQALYDEVKIKLNHDPNQHQKIWERWLLAPHYQRLQSLLEHLSAEQKQQAVETLLPELKKRLHKPDAALTYTRILMDFGHYTDVATFFLTMEKDPLKIKQDKFELLQQLALKQPELAKAIFHQYALRLIEKKSRVHYEQAAQYIKQLKKLYMHTENTEEFLDYIEQLKKKYRTYRAFIEELKTVE